MDEDPAALAAAVTEALRPVEGVRVAWLFGSRVSGRAREDSDLDVLVVYPRDLDARGRERARRAVVGALTDALGPIGERADVVDADEADSAVAFAALRDGVRVLSRSELERVEATVRVMRRYDDEAHRRALYARSAERAARRMGEEARGKS